MKIAKLIIWGIVSVLSIGLPVSAQQQDKLPSAAKEAFELLMRDTGSPPPDLSVIIKINQNGSSFKLNDYRPLPGNAGQDPKQVDYPASHLLVSINTPLSLLVTAEDNLYEIKAPKLGIEMSAIPGRLSAVGLIISKPGRYEISCRENCSPASDKPYLNIHAVDEATYWTWYKDHHAKQN